MKQLNQSFENVTIYAASMEQWVNDNFGGGHLHYTFVGDFAIADWVGGKDEVINTYKRIKDDWINDYKAFTEVVIALNMLAWAHLQLKKQDISGRDPFITLYSTLYNQAVSDFYEKYGKEEDKCDYFYQMTD